MTRRDAFIWVCTILIVLATSVQAVQAGGELARPRTSAFLASGLSVRHLNYSADPRDAPKVAALDPAIIDEVMDDHAKMEDLRAPEIVSLDVLPMGPPTSTPRPVVSASATPATGGSNPPAPSTPLPPAVSTPLPLDSAQPTVTPKKVSPVPSNTPTAGRDSIQSATPTRTDIPSSTATPTRTSIPSSTATPRPSLVPTSTRTPTPSLASTATPMPTVLDLPTETMAPAPMETIPPAPTDTPNPPGPGGKGPDCTRVPHAAPCRTEAP